MWNPKKQNKQTKQNENRLIDTENKWVVTRREVGRWWEVQTIGCKRGYKDVLYNMGNRANIL